MSPQTEYNQTTHHLSVFAQSDFVTATVSMDTYRAILIRRPGFVTVVVTEEMEDFGMPAGTTTTFAGDDVRVELDQDELVIRLEPEYWAFPLSFLEQFTIMEN